MRETSTRNSGRFQKVTSTQARAQLLALQLQGSSSKIYTAGNVWLLVHLVHISLSMTGTQEDITPCSPRQISIRHQQTNCFLAGTVRT